MTVLILAPPSPPFRVRTSKTNLEGKTKHMNQKTLTVAELREALASQKSATPIAFCAITSAKARKNPYGEIRKVSFVQAFTACDYEKSVNRQREREGSAQNFQAEARQWGERVAPCLVENKGKSYLVAHVTRAKKPLFYVQSAGIWKGIEKAEIASFLYTSSAPKQELEKEVIYRNYSLDNIRSISIGGKKYKIRRD